MENNQVLFNTIFESNNITVFGTEKEPTFSFQEIMFTLGYKHQDRFWRKMKDITLAESQNKCGKTDTQILENQTRLESHNHLISWFQTFEILCMEKKSNISKQFRKHLFEIYEELRLKNHKKIEQTNQNPQIIANEVSDPLQNIIIIYKISDDEFHISRCQKRSIKKLTKELLKDYPEAQFHRQIECANSIKFVHALQYELKNMDLKIKHNKVQISQTELDRLCDYIILKSKI